MSDINAGFTPKYPLLSEDLVGLYKFEDSLIKEVGTTNKSIIVINANAKNVYFDKTLTECDPPISNSYNVIDFSNLPSTYNVSKPKKPITSSDSVVVLRRYRKCNYT